MDKKKIAIVAAGSFFGLALLALLVLWSAVQIKKKRVYIKESTDGKGKDSDSASGSTDWSDFPLKWGSGTSRNRNVSQVKWGVKQIQRVCNGWVKSGLIVDGIWGDKTEAAVQKLRAVKARPKYSDAVSGGGYDYSSVVQSSPFASYISTVQDPASHQSKVQITNQTNLNSIIAWHKAHVNDYVKIS